MVGAKFQLYWKGYWAEVLAYKFIHENRREIYFRKHLFYILSLANFLYSAALIGIDTNMRWQEEAAKRSTYTR